MGRGPELTLEQAAAIVDGRSVAVVGNDEAILLRRHGSAIDSHDVVLRMNAGAPQQHQRKALGVRTDILTVGKRSLLDISLSHNAHPQQLWWMKLTAAGDAQFLKYDLPIPVWRYPRDLEARVHERVGYPPSTGIRVLDFLQHYAAPKAVSVFGISCFGKFRGGTNKTWYRPPGTKRVTGPHVGHAEANVMRTMGFVPKEDGWLIRKT